MHDAPSILPAENATNVTDDVIEEVARASGRDRRSVMRRLLGLEVKGEAGRAIDREIASRGLFGGRC